HEHDVGPLAAGAQHRLYPIGHDGDDLDVVDQAEQHGEPVADDRLIVGDQDADTHAGTSISTRHPASIGPAHIVPPARSIRSRSPSSPRPPPISGRGGVAETPLSTDNVVRSGS